MAPGQRLTPVQQDAFKAVPQTHGSRDFAFHRTYRVQLRSSSEHEPRRPHLQAPHRTGSPSMDLPHPPPQGRDWSGSAPLRSVPFRSAIAPPLALAMILLQVPLQEPCYDFCFL